MFAQEYPGLVCLPENEAEALEADKTMGLGGENKSSQPAASAPSGASKKVHPAPVVQAVTQQVQMVQIRPQPQQVQYVQEAMQQVPVQMAGGESVRGAK